MRVGLWRLESFLWPRVCSLGTRADLRLNERGLRRIDKIFQRLRLSLSVYVVDLWAHYSNLFGPVLNFAQCEQLLGSWPRPIILIHARLVDVAKILSVVLAVDRQMLRIPHLVDKSLLHVSGERRASLAKLEQHDPEAPDVRPIIVASLLHGHALDRLWALIQQSTHIFDVSFAKRTLAGNAEITELNPIFLAAQENVTWLDVTVYYVVGV